VPCSTAATIMRLPRAARFEAPRTSLPSSATGAAPSLHWRTHAPSARSSASGGSDDRTSWKSDAADAAGAVRRRRLGLRNAPAAASCSWSMRRANSANAVTPR